MAIDPTTGLDSTLTTNATNVPLPTVTTPTYTPGQSFSFDPNQYLPKIQQTASALYDPQKAQIQALQQIGSSKTEQAKVTTNKQFDKELSAKIESINQRGAFFGPGAINQQGDVEQRRTTAINDLTLNNQAAQAGYLAQLAGLSAEQAQYIQEQLTNKQTGAYGMWNDAYQRFQDQQQQANWEKDYKLRKKSVSKSSSSKGGSSSSSKSTTTVKKPTTKKKATKTRTA